jgi:hypothetical protein
MGMAVLGPMLALALAAGARTAVMPISPGASIPQEQAASLTDTLAAELRQQSRGEVITARDLGSLLSFEKQKQAVGCTTDSCMAELAGAAGADRLVAGDVAKLGDSLLLQLRLLDVKAARVVAQSHRRFKKGTFDDLLDALPTMVGELVRAIPAGSVDRPAAQAVPSPTPAASAAKDPPASAIPGPAVVLHLHREDGAYDGLRLVSWNTFATAADLRSPPPGVLTALLGSGEGPAGQDAFGAFWRLPVASFPSGRLIFLVRKRAGWDECVHADTSKPLTPQSWILASGLEAWVNVPECELFATEDAAVKARRRR